MSLTDTLRFALAAIAGAPLRSALMMLAMAIGVAAVVVLTALGDGARNYVVAEFNALGSNVIIVFPGRNETGGVSPGGLITDTPRDLTVADALSLARLPGVRRVAPLAVGTTELAAGGRLREALLVGTTAEFIEMRRFRLAAGRFLPHEDPEHGSAVCVIGAKLRSELFGAAPAVGKLVRLGDRRLRVIGVLGASGQGLGMNTDEMVLIPVSQGLALLNSSTLLRIMLEARERGVLTTTKQQVEDALAARHDGERDVTVVTQDAIVATFDRVLAALTFAVAGIAAISLAVAGILVMNVMLVAVTQRTGEIGLLKALGASGAAIRRAFLTEAALLSLAGAALGWAAGQAGAWAVRFAWPVLPAWPPAWAVAAAVLTALSTGLLFGLLPARRAAALDPVAALARH